MADQKKTSKSLEPNCYVGVGASAGGLEALESFFRKMPADTGMAFIVIQHLSPDYKSLMTDILSKKTALDVYQAEEGMKVEANTIYLIPPKMDLRIFNGKLTLSEKQVNRGVNFPIDLFLSSLAQDQGRHAVGIILSGTGSDGTRGLRAIKEEAGLVMVQDVETAAFDGMPRSAIAAGVSDFVLAPELMAEQLLSYVNHPFKAGQQSRRVLPENEDSLTRLFSLLREKHGVDFSDYKPATIIRRIERRIAINQVSNLEDYLGYIHRHPTEITELYREFLIGVTSFFRDTDAFTLLADKYIPELLKRSSKDEEIRVWSAGCSTGEETYSLAILFLEALKNLNINRDVKIFATDVDKNATVSASLGRYPESIVADIPKNLLEKYFVRVEEGFQVTRELREMIVFAQHNLIKDPPFTKMSMISCRNLLIYLQPVLQKKVIDLFNFSLIPNGLLFLGSSETLGELTECFDSLDNKWKIHQSRGIKRFRDNTHGDGVMFDMSRRIRSMGGKPAGTMAAREYMHERLLERFLNIIAENYIDFGMLINSSQEVLHLIGDASRFLRFSPGKLQSDIGKLLHPDLSVPITTGIQKALREQTTINYSNVRLSEDKDKNFVNIRLCPVPHKSGLEPLLAVFINCEKQQNQAIKNNNYDVGQATTQRIADLEHELQFSRENLQATVEELETSNEELQATNEELLASNEELQSTNEELQSVNEELFTVNAEYQEKITELTESDNDLDNLLNSIRMATIYLDENLELRRFTSETRKIFKILDKDIGRPLSHIAHSLVDVDLDGMIQQCLDDDSEVTQTVSTMDGATYLLRVLPYCVGPKTNAGLILSFIDHSIFS
ncbi:MAG: chemotaxis protein CheB [Desulfuromusa sp.]|jgi:two-component system CheB/CheR fusion protein|nr:chemotaxis protein CheB [Desulfuromusa sp.]